MNIKAFLLIIVLQFLPFVIYAEQPLVDCGSVKVNYEKLTSEINRACDLNTKCQVSRVMWEPCDILVAHNDPEIVSQLVEHRKELHEMCNFKETSCQDSAVQVFCVNHQCKTRAEIDLAEDLNLKFRLISGTLPLADKKVQVLIDTGIRCASAPCPSSKEVVSLTTDLQGLLVLKQRELFHILDQQGFSADPAMLSIDKYGFVSVDLRTSLIDISRTVDLNFTPQ